MFSVELEGQLAESMFYMTKQHNYQPSEILNMTYVDYRVVVALLNKFLKEEEARYEKMKRSR